MGSIFGINGSSSNQNNYNLTASMFQSGSGNALGDMALIRSGAYKKLLSAYYKNDSSSNPKDMVTDDKEKNNLVIAKDSAAELKKSANSLMNADISEEGRSDLKEKLKSFVKDYNAMLDAGSDVDTQAVLRSTLWMTQSTSKNSGLLNDLGISVGTDNKLTLDEEKFDKAQLSTMKTLFKGTDSFVGRAGSRADSIAKIAVKTATQGTSAALYNKTGNYDSISAAGLFNKTK